MGPLPTDDADQCPRRVCSWRCCHLPPGLEEQSESEHPTLADGSCPGYGQPHSRVGGGTPSQGLSTPQALLSVADLGCWLQSHSELCCGLSGQPHPGSSSQSKNPVTHLQRPAFCVLWTPHSASHSAPPHLSFHQLLLFFCPQRHVHQGERDLVGHGPAPHSVLPSPLSHLTGSGNADTVCRPRGGGQTWAQWGAVVLSEE